MTRKDYVLIAAAMNAEFLMLTPDAKIHFMRCCEALATALGHDNPRFDRQRFMNACTAPPEPTVVFGLVYVGGYRIWGDVRYSSRESAQQVCDKYNQDGEGPFWVAPIDVETNTVLKYGAKR